MALQTITKDILTRTDGIALLGLPYDICWVAGFDKEWALEDLGPVPFTAGQAIMARPGEFIGAEGYIDTPSTGGGVIVDVEKNGTTIYSPASPSFNLADTPPFTLSNYGDISTTTFIAGDLITFKITQRGTGDLNPIVRGQGVRFTLKCRV